MLSGVSVSNPGSSKAPQGARPFRKVGENLYRLKTSGTYYALLKRGGKQIRKSLKTKDKELAARKLGELREKVSRLNTVPCEEAVKTPWTLNNNSAFDGGVFVIGSHR